MAISVNIRLLFIPIVKSVRVLVVIKVCFLHIVQNQDL